ncbi:MAG: TonB-dependent receptor [Lysobacteraceae bacterium]|nr:MAG: TonB-dependent receptor [Xanthomonadaceae bacterium]
MPRRKAETRVPRRLLAVALASFALMPRPLLAQDVPATLDAIVVRGAPLPSAPLRQPSAVSVVEAEAVRARAPSLSAEEVLRTIPGLAVRDRHNAAQDLQLSVRGAGARSAFGMRGMRIVVDGIPATMPDGQSQISHLDLGSLQHLEVLRGPLSVLQGNASAGVIVAETERGEAPATLRLAGSGDSTGQWRWGLGGSMAGERWDLRLGLARQAGDGFRQQSASTKSQGNLRFGWQDERLGRVDVVLNSLDQQALDPQGLTRSELDATPWKAASSALLFDTRKDTRQDQLGIAWRNDFSERNGAALALYGGSRAVTQFQSIPVATQAAAGHGGGVIGLDRDYGGLDAKWFHRSSSGVRAVVGIARERMQEHRRGWENFVQDAAGLRLGVRGRLRRDEDNRLRSTDAYAQLQWPLSPALSLDTGLRHSRIDIAVRDRFLANGDDSGDVQFRRSLPVAALHWHPATGRALHLAWGRGFETPTLNELAYRPTGDGPNRGLRPAVSSQWELGGSIAQGQRQWTAAWFDIRTRDEIVVDGSSDGRTTYRNAAHTVRRGLELGWTWRSTRWQADAAWTWLDASLRDGASGDARLPGTARGWGAMDLQYALRNGLRVGSGMDASRRIETGGNARAPGAVTWHLFGRRTWDVGRSRINAFVRVDNLFDRRYAGSVIVGQAQGRYFEPAPGRSVALGFELKMRGEVE